MMYIKIALLDEYQVRRFFCGLVSLVFAWINDERLTMKDPLNLP